MRVMETGYCTENRKYPQHRVDIQEEIDITVKWGVLIGWF